MPSDLVIVNARVFTAVPGAPFAESLAIQSGRISAVGDVAERIGPRTEIVDAGGSLVTPGFIDAHVHPATSGLDALRCSFDHCASSDDALEYVASYASKYPERDWILGAGWSMTWFESGCPSRERLDRVVPDRPALVWNADGHGAWANTRALEMAGITADTPDPPDGRIERQSDGSPQGTLHEGAVALIEALAPANTVADYADGLRRGQQELLSHGVTGWQDAMVDMDVQQAYLRLANSGELVGRAVGALWWDRHRGMEQLEELLVRRANSGPNFSPTSVKLMLDGVAENYSASLLDPWLDRDANPTDNSGTDFIDPDHLGAVVTKLDAEGFQCHFHALGDAAVRYALDSVEIARKLNGASDNRHHLAHLQFVHPDDIPRFAILDVAANVQPLWACNDRAQTDLTRPYISPERDSWQYPFGSLALSGARLAMGSDWGVSTANVMEEIQVATTRSIDGGEPLGPAEALDIESALMAFTTGSAYVNHAEQDQGSLSDGKHADVVVFDRNPFLDESFGEAKVAMTIVGGEVVYEGN